MAYITDETMDEMSEAREHEGPWEDTLQVKPSERVWKEFSKEFVAFTDMGGQKCVCGGKHTEPEVTGFALSSDSTFNVECDLICKSCGGRFQFVRGVPGIALFSLLVTCVNAADEDIF